MYIIKKFKPEYITISLLVIMSLVLLLGLTSGVSSSKEFITNSLIIVLLLFLTFDIKNSSTGKKITSSFNKYIGLIFLFCLLNLI
ncbi:hypothetical protein JOC86_004042 [Bacillus pakistanensis]|uniref:Uncharacterized protein n=1 Tax=Rossellomorea pakistanensis TaxID=992288 RepID=A0ABS2NHY4_9BACI|nr:hypothetical protein [Bacillus pakistanensis]